MLNDPLLFEPDLEVFPPGSPVFFSCPPGYTLQGTPFSLCSATSFTFENIVAFCIPSKLTYTNL